MKNRYLSSFISSAFSIVPMILIIVAVSLININGLRLVELQTFDYIALVFAAVILISGLAFFQIGTTNSLSKVGEYMGASLSQQSNIFVVIIFTFALGALITVAEPSILVVASQVSVPFFALIGSIGLGVGIFCVIGVVRIILHKSLKIWYLFFYFIVFGLTCLISINKEMAQFLPFIFDSGGITTGSATVPFILALGAGVAVVRGGKNATEDSFGLVGMASIGPILSMTLLLLFNYLISGKGFDPYIVNIPGAYTDIGGIFIDLGKALIPTSSTHLGSLVEVALALLPIIIIFVIYEKIFIKLPKDKIKTLLLGFAFSYVGLAVFLTGVNALMQPMGYRVGAGLGRTEFSNWVIVLICFIIGLVTILCEPAVHVLTTQINEISDGNISKRTVLITLSIGVGIAIGLASIRTLFNFSILYIIVPGYMLSIALMFICPSIYVAMAFDAGGTASGPMSTSFVLPMIVGITFARFGSTMEDPHASITYYQQSLGVVALIAMTPIIAIQILGVAHNIKKVYQLRVMSGLVHDPDNDQIIHFN